MTEGAVLSGARENDSDDQERDVETRENHTVDQARAAESG